MKILFMGTPEIAAVCLTKLLSSTHTVVGAVCQPDKPKGRGYTLTPPPVKAVAENAGIPVYQPQTMKDEAFLPVLNELKPDLIAVIAYGKILPPYIIHFPKYGCVNIHASLLPKYRGAAPMQRAIMEGEKETGVTTMLMDEGLDTGDMLLQETFPITEASDLEEIHGKTAEVGAKLLLETVEGLEKGIITPKKQEGESTYARKIEKEDCVLDFNRSATELSCQIRGLSPMPLAFTHTPDGKILKVISCECDREKKGVPFQIVDVDPSEDGYVAVGCGEGVLRLKKVLPEGKKRMTAGALARGRKLKVGDFLS